MFISAVTLDVLTINTSVLNPSLQEYNGLVDRVNVAKADTEGAIKLINSKSDELEDALKTLKGRLTERWGGTHRVMGRHSPSDGAALTTITLAAG